MNGVRTWLPPSRWNEYYFGGGIQSSPAGTTPYGRPLRTVELGVTHIPREVFVHCRVTWKGKEFPKS